MRRSLLNSNAPPYRQLTRAQIRPRMHRTGGIVALRPGAGRKGPGVGREAQGPSRPSAAAGREWCRTYPSPTNPSGKARAARPKRCRTEPSPTNPFRRRASPQRGDLGGAPPLQQALAGALFIPFDLLKQSSEEITKKLLFFAYGGVLYRSVRGSFREAPRTAVRAACSRHALRTVRLSCGRAPAGPDRRERRGFHGKPRRLAA